MCDMNNGIPLVHDIHRSCFEFSVLNNNFFILFTTVVPNKEVFSKCN